jgi:hypothetical protein
MGMLGFEALLAMVRVPVAEPEAAGEKTIFTVTLCPLLTVAGIAGGELRVKSLPLMLTWDTIILVSAELLRATEMVFLPPTATLPKSMEVEDTVSDGDPVEAVLGAGARVHPASKAVATSTNPNKLLLRIAQYLTR